MTDLVIRGMEMPMPLCKTELIVFPSGVVQVYDSRENYLGKAEAVPLPEGHGDLIDRDAFRADNGLNAKCEHCQTNTYECQHDMIHTKMDLCGMLDDAPVIVPAEGGEADGNCS